MKIDDIYMLGALRGPMPVERRLVVKSKGEAPKCKTCVHYYTRRVCCDPMKMACDRYERKKKK